jgi:hypothetical protein
MQDRIIANSILSGDSGYDGTPCWIWIGERADNGYGRMTVYRQGPVKAAAHRVSYEAFVGPIPDGQVVKHHCNTKLCVAPLHLEAGTQSENIKQCIAQGRHNNFGKAVGV